MRVFAAPHKGTGREAAVALAIEIDVATLDLVEQGGTFRAEGRYQLRAAAASGTQSGSVVYDLEVPDFNDGELVLSGISLSSGEGDSTSTVRPEPADGRQRRPQRCEPPSCDVPLVDGTPSSEDPLRDGLPGPATTRREFDLDESIFVFAEVYANVRGTAAHTIAFATCRQGEDGTRLPMTSEERTSTSPRRPSGGHGFTAALSLRDVHAMDVRAARLPACTAPVRRTISCG